ncbi:Protein CBR-SRU-42 [Caenorhabditis briggsae]|uniref:Protein CBR-SRU-42 n=1 Tax=Caenorhabditis briggsae TaxID=6238 RepID=A8X7L3_CAEBR|nr:Protein CBR-SRU-42 [Caenorhabditis briggsae]CAP28624.2 Protein CBR-SRU-42 [Caenorhabditis briggsae]
MIIPIFMAFYSIPCLFFLFKITFFYFSRNKAIKEASLDLELFQLFLFMQFSNFILIFADFLIFRIPFTGIFTNFCILWNPQFFMESFVFLFYFGFYTSQMFTPLFCGARVAIMYNLSKRKLRKIVKITSCAIMFSGFLLALPHFLARGECIQVDKPLPFGSIFITSSIHFNHFQKIGFGNFVLNVFITASIIFLNCLMVQKIRQRKLINVRSSNLKIERTLTGTMIILLFPLIMNLLVAKSTQTVKFELNYLNSYGSSY